MFPITPFLLISYYIFVLSSAEIINPNNLQQERKEFLQIDIFEECEGKDVANYTYIRVYTEDSACSYSSLRVENQPETITASLTNKHTVVNTLRILTSMGVNNGVFVNEDTLFQVLSGSLEGKYIYKRSVYTNDIYLKKCTSVLGNGIIRSKFDEILISDKLDLNIFVNPNGPYQEFKKGASTICRGQEYDV